MIKIGKSKDCAVFLSYEQFPDEWRIWHLCPEF